MQSRSLKVSVIPEEKIESKIYFIRGHKIMLDVDLAQLYDVQTGMLNRSVKRNLERFPDEFMFRLTPAEYQNLRCQTGISSAWGGRRYLPLAFTEKCVAMLSSALNSRRAIQVNIQIMKTFTKLRQMLLSHAELRRKVENMERKYDHQFREVFDAIRKLLEPGTKPKRQIGFHP